MEEIVELRSEDEAHALYGSRDRNIRKIQEVFGVNVVARNNMVKLSGESERVNKAVSLILELLEKMRGPSDFSREKMSEIFRERMETSRAEETYRDLERVGKVVLRTEGQKKYVKAIRENDITFAVGPAGTGKTFLAVMAAVDMLREGAVRKIALVRPAVEAGEKLGFLPGDFQAKINPYLRPLYDSLYYLLDADAVKKYVERDIIEICPLAYMRGRTLSKAFIILDEAQNTTDAQMKMFLTRMGEGSKIVVTGDITQVDLERSSDSGLVKARKKLRGIDRVAFVEMTARDVVRHRIVRDIINAYEKHEKKKKDGKGRR